MKKGYITLENNNYELVRNYKDAFYEEEVRARYTDYFQDYDYIFGDYSYDKLRLKGFYDKKNRKANAINSIERLDSYILEYCSYECRYFLLKLVKK